MSLVENAARFGLDATVAAQVEQRIANGEIVLLGVSGKLASGKDTVAAAAMAKLGVDDPAHAYYADALKNEVDQVLAIVREARHDAGVRVATEQGITLEQASHVCELLTADLQGTPDLHARSRTQTMRKVLQYWGTEIRRTQDSEYWVRKTLRGALSTAARGRSVYITDLRFPNEALWAQQLGFLVARIEVSQEVQAERLSRRDQLPPAPEALLHASETALDTYDRFDVVLDNNGSMAGTVEQLAEALRERFHR